jgi:proline iminopeptidase
VAHAWIAWEHALAGATLPTAPDLQLAIDRYRVQSHYLAHRCWLGDGALREAARTVPPVPVHFLHGESDAVCRPAAAQALHRLIPGSRFETVPHAGHDPMHPAMFAAMQAALRSFADHLASHREKDPA